MTAADIDLEQIKAAAAAALAAPVDLAPAGVYEAHQCQTGCGRLATVVLVRLADSDIDILCDVCYLLMAMAVAAEIPAAPAVDQQDGSPQTSADTGNPPTAQE